jgi:hypothetical protein
MSPLPGCSEDRRFDGWSWPDLPAYLGRHESGQDDQAAESLPKRQVLIEHQPTECCRHDWAE